MSEAASMTGAVAHDPAATGRAGRWRSLSAMAVAFVSDNTESGLVNTLFPVIRQALGLGLDALGLLTSISRFARMIFGPLWSMAADKYGRKRVRLVRIVDEDRSAVRMPGSQLHAPANAVQMPKRIDRPPGVATRRNDEAKRAEDVPGLERADQRQFQLVPRPVQRERDRESVRQRIQPRQPDPVARAAIGENLPAGGQRGGPHPFKFRNVGVEDGGRPDRQHLVDKPGLGLQVILDRRMIVQVIAAEVREAGGR